MRSITSRATRVLAAAVLALGGIAAAGAPAQASDVIVYSGGSTSYGLLFDAGSAQLKSALQARIDANLAGVPAKPWTVVLSVMTSATAQSGAAATLAQKRVDAAVAAVKGKVEAAGGQVSVIETIWYQPGYMPRYAKLARMVYVDLNW